MKLSDETLKEIGYVKISTYRTKVMKVLEKHPEIPSKIAKKSNIRQSNIPTTMKQLLDHDLIECVNPEYNKGRLYRLTDKGREISKHLDNTII